MYLSICLAILSVTCSIGDAQSVSPSIVPQLAPYNSLRNPAFGYNPYNPYTSASGSVPILSYKSNQGIDGSYDFRLILINTSDFYFKLDRNYK